MKKLTPLHWIYLHTKYIIPRLMLLAAVGGLLSLCSVGFALLSRNLIDIATKHTAGNFTFYCIGLGGLILLQVLLNIAFISLNARTSGKLNVSLKKKVFENILHKDYREVSNNHSGDLLNRIHGDVGVVTGAVVSIIPNVISYTSRIVFSFAALFMLDKMFALLFLVVGTGVLFASRIYSVKLKLFHKKSQESDGKVRAFMQECIQNLLVIKSFRNEDTILSHATNLQEQNYRHMIKRSNVSLFANVSFFMGMSFAYYLAIAWGAYKLSFGLITFGTLTAMMQLVGQVQMPFRNLSSSLPQYYSMLASAERLIEIEQLTDEGFLHKSSDIALSKMEAFSSIRISNLTFCYEEKVVLEKACCFIRKGEFVTISGESGVGKSTLLKLLLAIFEPTKGEIFVDFEDGKSLRVDRHTRGLFAYVPQGNMLLSGTIAENIAFTKSAQMDEQKMIFAARVAHLGEVIDKLPDGLHTKVGEDGVGLSEGQVQRIAIARAIYYDAPILLLDEATSALDVETERKVLSNIKALITKTCIFVSHKQSAHFVCDRNLSVCGRKIVENGKEI